MKRPQDDPDNAWRGLYHNRMIALKTKHRLSFTHNPGGGAFYRDDLGDCQIDDYGDYKADHARLLAWLREKGLETP